MRRLYVWLLNASKSIGWMHESISQIWTHQIIKEGIYRYKSGWIFSFTGSLTLKDGSLGDEAVFAGFIQLPYPQDAISSTGGGQQQLLVDVFDAEPEAFDIAVGFRRAVLSGGVGHDLHISQKNRLTVHAKRQVGFLIEEEVDVEWYQRLAGQREQKEIVEDKRQQFLVALHLQCDAHVRLATFPH